MVFVSLVQINARLHRCRRKILPKKAQQRIRLLTVSLETFSVTARDVHFPVRPREGRGNKVLRSIECASFSIAILYMHEAVLGPFLFKPTLRAYQFFTSEIV